MTPPAAKTPPAPGDQTIAELLAAAAATLSELGSPSPRRDAEVLLEGAAGWDAAHRIAAGGERAEATLRDRFAALVARRGAGEPVAYLLGHKEFYSLSLTVDRRVLIPRPETEHVVEAALVELERLRRSRSGRLEARETGAERDRVQKAGQGALRVVDVGTGSGAIALALASATSAWPGGSIDIVALDRSEGALAVARENFRALGLAERLRWLRADLTSAFADGAVDLVVANPPYLSEDELSAAPTDLHFEPREALYGGNGDGLGVFRTLVADAFRALRSDGAFVSEIGATQGAAAVTSAENFGYRNVVLSRDLAGHDRVVVARKPA